MSPAFEAFLAKLYVDAAARERFLRDPRGEAASRDARLTAEEVEALANIDRTGLELAAASFEAKRRHAARPRRGGWRLSARPHPLTSSPAYLPTRRGWLSRLFPRFRREF